MKHFSVYTSPEFEFVITYDSDIISTSGGDRLDWDIKKGVQ